jgi:Apc13p protein
MHHPRLADFFEDFTRPHTSLYSNLAAAAATAHHQHQHGASTAHASAAAAATAAATAPGGTGTASTFLPIEDIYVLPQYQPLNPEDEDDVVPDQHAAFGITRAMETRREPVWRDLGLAELVTGARMASVSTSSALFSPSGRIHGRAGAGGAGGPSGWRLKQAGALMGGRRTVCLR